MGKFDELYDRILNGAADGASGGADRGCDMCGKTAAAYGPFWDIVWKKDERPVHMCDACAVEFVKDHRDDFFLSDGDYTASKADGEGSYKLCRFCDMFFPEEDMEQKGGRFCCKGCLDSMKEDERQF